MLTIQFGSHTISFDPQEKYHSTFVTSDLEDNKIEELFPVIKVAKNGRYYLPFIVDKVTRTSMTYTPGLVRVIDWKVVRPAKADFNICVYGHTSTKKVTYFCEPLTID